MAKKILAGIFLIAIGVFILMSPSKSNKKADALLFWKDGAYGINLSAKTGEGLSRYITGEQISLEINSDADAHVIVVMKDSEGKFVQLMPNPFIEEKTIKAGETLRLPPEDMSQGFPIQPPYGEMTFKIIVSKKAIELNPDPNNSEFSFLKILGKDPKTWFNKSFKEFKKDNSMAVKTIVIQTEAQPTHPHQASDNLLLSWEKAFPLQTRGGPTKMPMRIKEKVVEGLIVTYKERQTTRGSSPLLTQDPQSPFFKMGVVQSEGTRSVGDEDWEARREELIQDPNVQRVIPNYRRYLFSAPMVLEPYQWSIENRYKSKMDCGWSKAQELIKTIEPVPLAVVDQGLTITDPRLKSIAWTNPKEIAGNGKDDDGNGLIDDIHGFNFFNFSNELHYGDDEFNHGSFVASIITGGSAKDHDTLKGLSPKSKVITSVGMGAMGFGSDMNILQALNYAIDSGAKVINLSLGGESNEVGFNEYNEYFQLFYQKAIDKGVILVAAAGNENANMEHRHIIPAGLPYPNIISVMAIDPDGAPGRYRDEEGNWVQYTNYGKTKVDIAAPGSLVLGIPSRGKQELNFGTSFAAPIVSAACALVWGQHPEWTYDQVIRAVLETAKPEPMLKDQCVTGGVLNLPAALAWRP